MPVALRHREFRNLWFGTLVSTGGTQMASVAIAWHVYILTQSPVALLLSPLLTGGKSEL